MSTLDKIRKQLGIALRVLVAYPEKFSEEIKQLRAAYDEILRLQADGDELLTRRYRLREKILDKALGKLKRTERILLVSKRLEVCDACEAVIDFVSNAIASDKVTVVDIADSRGVKIAGALYKGKPDFLIPAYIIKEGDRYSEGDLKDLMVEYGND